MRILVTGGAGYIGSHAVRLFLDRGHDTWVYDNLSAGHRAAVPNERLIVGDVADTDLLERTLQARGIEAVVHFAGHVSAGESVKDPAKYWRNNFVSTLGLLDAMRNRNVSRFVFSSTAATYGTPEQVPITETCPQQPINPYGESKLAVERALRNYALAYGLGYAALRYFNAAGAHPRGDLGEDHDPETHLIPRLIQAVQGHFPHVEVFGEDYPTDDGTCIRDYVHVDDLADAHLLALESLSDGSSLAYNLGTGRGHSVRDVVRAVEDVTGKKVPLVIGPRRPGDPATLVASAEKIHRELGWAPKYNDLRSIVETAWRFHRAHPNGYAR